MLHGTTPASLLDGGGVVGGQTVGNWGWREAQEALGEASPGVVMRVVGFPSGDRVEPSGFGSAGDVPSTRSVPGTSSSSDMLHPHEHRSQALVNFSLVLTVLRRFTASMAGWFWR